MTKQTRRRWGGVVFLAAVSGLFWMGGPLSSSAEMRVWTSKTGNTVEAEFIRREGPYVFLQKEDGGELRIHGAQLSPTDIQYVKAQPVPAIMTPTPEEKAPAPEVKETSTVPKPAEKKPAPAAAKETIGPFSYQPMEKKDVESLGFPSPRAENEVFRYALRFGERPSDVMYCMFDTDSWENNHDRAYVLVPGHPQYGEPTLLQSKSQKFEEETAYFFTPISLKSKFGTMNASINIILSVGEPRKGMLGVRADVTLQRARDRCQFLLKGYLNDVAAYAEDRFPEVRLFGKPDVLVTGSDQGKLMVSANQTMGKFALIGISGMDKKVSIAVLNEKGNTVKKLKWEPDEDEVYKTSHGGVHTVDSLDVKAGAYTVGGASDLGPIFGVVDVAPRKVDVK